MSNETKIVKTSNPELESVENRIEYEIQKFSLPDQKLAELKEIYSKLEIKGIEDKSGYKEVTEAIKVMRTLRTGVENKRKELKDWYLQTGRGIDGEAKRLTELIVEIEDPLKVKKEKIDAEKERVKKEEEEREKKRIDDRVNELIESGISFNGNFYSVGDNISVDIVTIAELNDQDFERLKSKVKEEKKRIDEENRIAEMHEARKEDLLPFWSFMTEKDRLLNFGKMSDNDYKNFRSKLESEKKEFEAEAERRKKEAIRQAEEAERLEKEKKKFNLERRSFNYEKQGFKMKGDIMVKMAGGKPVTVAVNHLENASEEHFQQAFKENMEMVVSYEEEAEKERKRREAEAEAKAKEKERKELEALGLKRLNKLLNEFGVSVSEEGFLKSISGNKYNVTEGELKDMDEDLFYNLVNDAKNDFEDHQKQLEAEREKERMSRLPDVEKFENYINSIKGLEVPVLSDRDLNDKLISVSNNYKSMANDVLKFLKQYK